MLSLGPRSPTPDGFFANHIFWPASHTAQMVGLYRKRFEHYGHGSADQAIVGLGGQVFMRRNSQDAWNEFRPYFDHAPVYGHGPSMEEFSVPARAVPPVDLPDELRCVLLAVKAQDTQPAVAAVGPHLAPDGFVVSLQNGMNESVIAAAVGEERTVGAFVNFGADYLGPGRIFVGGRGTFRVGELDGRRSERVQELAADLADAEVTDNILGFLWAQEAYGAMLFATAVSDLSIADALAEQRYRPLYLRLADEVLACATANPETFDGFDPTDLEGSIERLVAFNRRSAKTHSGIYRDLAVRKRRTEAAMFDGVDGQLLSRTLALVHEIEEGR